MEEMARDLFDESLDTLTRALGQSVTNKDWLQSWIDAGTALQQRKRDYHAKLQTLVEEIKPEHLPRKKKTLQAEFAKVLAAHQAQYVDGGMAEHIAQLKRSAKPKEAPQDMAAVLRFLQLQELRSELKGVDPVLLRGEYESRSQDTSGQSDSWLEAVENAPTPLLPAEVLDHGKNNRSLRLLEPKHRQELSDLESLREATAYLLLLASRELPARDEIAELANTEEPSTVE